PPPDAPFPRRTPPPPAPARSSPPRHPAAARGASHPPAPPADNAAGSPPSSRRHTHQPDRNPLSASRSAASCPQRLSHGTPRLGKVRQSSVRPYMHHCPCDEPVRRS